MIGIFWVYKKTVIGKDVEVSEGEESAPEIIDSPDNHADFWDEKTNYKYQFPELEFIEYFDVPRGRVLFHRGETLSIVYLDKTLFDEESKKLIVDFFKLHHCEISWRTDPHYTTDQADLDRLIE